MENRTERTFETMTRSNPTIGLQIHWIQKNLRKAHVRKLVGALLQARSGKQCIPPNDVFLMFAAGKLHNDHDITSGFLNAEGKLLPREKRLMHIQYEEPCLGPWPKCVAEAWLNQQIKPSSFVRTAMVAL